jgi:hypothetical protein
VGTREEDRRLRAFIAVGIAAGALDRRSSARRHFGVHGSAELPRVLALANPLSESPMETRIRLALVLAGLPAPTVQHRVRGLDRSHRLDLAYPDVLLAIEYDGADHLDPDRARRDLAREAVLTRLGWTGRGVAC